MSTPFRIDLEDFEFVFFDQLKVDQQLGATDAYAELDRDTYKATLAEAARMSTEVLAPINAVGDRQGCKLDDEGNVTTPDGFKEAWARMAEGGWIAPGAPTKYGGVGLPHVLALTVNEMFIGGCTAFMMYPGLTAAAARMIEAFGEGEMKDLVADKLFQGHWGGTMCLTESGAGSSVGDNRAKAVPAGDGVYHLEGEKIFITGGDSDMVENIIHLVLARTPGSPDGTKGLSLFVVPKYDFDGEGKLGERNGAKVVGLEHKMGINGSATCTLSLGADRPCKGWLLGKEREGITLMFKMMNEARIGVAGQGIGIAAAAYTYSLQYAKERLQGAPLAKRESSAVPIISHPDVRRMLMTIKVLTETMRSACIRTILDVDVAEAKKDKEALAKAEGRADLLIPVLKGHCTDLGFELATMAVQIYGGYGYTSEFPVEQLVRDAKIQSIYEGTNGIQALDLLGRKMRTQNGALFMSWMNDAQADLKAAAEEGFIQQAESIGKVLGQLGAAAMHLGKVAGGGKIDPAFIYAVPFLKTFGIVLLAMEAVDQARVAKRLIEANGESARLRSKLLGLDFYVSHILPQAVATAKTVQSSDESCLDEAVFA